MKTFLKSRSLLLLLGLAMMPFCAKAQVSVWDGTYTPWTKGTGTASDPFLIENARQLAYLANRVNNGLDAGGGHVSNPNYHYKLMVDVNLNGSDTFQWTPIGYWVSNTNYQCFGGHFDGNGHTISGLYVKGKYVCTGFFGCTSDANIENTRLFSDSLVGTEFGENVFNHGRIWSYSEKYLFNGGFVGYSKKTLIRNCCFRGAIRSHSNLNGYDAGVSFTGGVVGFADSVIICNCYSIGSIFAHGRYDYRCIFAGGLIGFTFDTITRVINSYYTGKVYISVYYSSSGNSGGVIGYTPLPNGIINCYYLSTCGGNNTYGGSPMSAANMRTAEFVDMLNAGTCAWEQDTMPYTNDGYPLLTMMITDANTDAATDLTAYSATLHGSVRVERATVVSKGFEYRAVGDSAYIVVPITQPTDTFSYLLNGLAINKNYEYRTFVKVAECIHTIYGEPQRFEISWLNEDTINIHDATMLRWVADKCNSGNTFAGKYIRLMNNIVLPKNVPNNMASIGIYPNYPFCGTFDGNGLLITNLYIDQPNTPYQGFFGYTVGAKLYEVGLVNITASGRNYTGGMVAYASNTTMRDCYVNGGTLFALSYCGGLVGYQDAGTASIISGCYNTCTVSGNNYVGGLVGYSNHATVRNSYVAAGVTAQGSAVGAIIGGADEVLMYNCWFNTNATGQSNAIGENNFKAGSEGMTDAEMRDPAFVATLNQGLSTPVWKSDYTKAINKGFPILKWQYSDAESCGAPENLSSSVNAGTITFRWSGGENAKSFIVEYGWVGDTAQQMQTTARQLQVNYQQGETYFWRVKSICSFGESGFVNGSNVSTGIAEVKAVPSLKIYPNPTDGKFTVSGVTCKRLQVSDMYGKVLGTFEANGETTVLDFSRYAAGVYVIRAWDGARMAGIGKVVKR
jgi:hypothetical protein